MFDGPKGVPSVPPTMTEASPGDPGSFIGRSQQAWKLTLQNACVALGVLLALAGDRGLFRLAEEKGVWIIPAVVLALAGAWYWASNSVRCPSCSLRLCWKAMSEQPLLQDRVWLRKLQVCPQCGSDGTKGGRL